MLKKTYYGNSTAVSLNLCFEVCLQNTLYVYQSVTITISGTLIEILTVTLTVSGTIKGSGTLIDLVNANIIYPSQPFIPIFV